MLVDICVMLIISLQTLTGESEETAEFGGLGRCCTYAAERIMFHRLVPRNK